MDGETRDLMIEAFTYAWREHCGVRGEDTGGQWPAHERVARSLLGGLERHGYTIVPTAQLAEAHATIAAQREALGELEWLNIDGTRRQCYVCGGQEDRHVNCALYDILAQPIPPAAKRLLALSTLVEDRVTLNAMLVAAESRQVDSVLLAGRLIVSIKGWLAGATA